MRHASAFGSTLTLLAALTLVAVQGCAIDAVEDDAVESDEALSSARIQTLGTIASGETKSIAYTTTPKYRAFDLTGKKDADVTFTASAANGSKVRVYLLGSDARTLKSSTTGALKATLAADGSYKVAVATVDSSSTTITLGFADAGEPGDVIPTCDGTPTFPTTGDLQFRSGTKTSFTRSCNAFGECTPWKRGASLPVSPAGNDSSIRLSPTGSVSVSAKVGAERSEESHAYTYQCSSTERGYGDVSLTTGIGEGSMRTGEFCTGAAGREDSPRAVTFRYGASCLAVTDTDPSMSYGAQTKSVLILPVSR